jgi:hypothetical protein
MIMRLGSRTGVLLLIRCLILAAAAAAALAGFALVRRGDASPGADKPAYSCPMHPKVRSSTPGDCPICRMALEPVKGKAALPDQNHDHGHGEKSAKEEAKELAHDPVPEDSFSIPSSPVFRAFDAVSRVKVHPISLEMRGPATIEENGGVGLFFLDESELLSPGEEGLFTPTAASHEIAAVPTRVRVSEARPTRWDSRTALVRFDLEGAGITPGTTGSVKFATRLRRGLVIKASAILATPNGSEVFVVSNDRRTFARRRVEIGNVIYGLAAVVSGLSPGEHVAAKHAFALDSEWRARREVSL